MNFRESILELLRRPDYRPGTVLDLSRALGLNKKQRPRLALPEKSSRAKVDAPRRKGTRPVFSPSSRRAPADAGNARTNSMPSASPGDDRDTVTGRIIFRQGGSALVIPAKTGPGPEPDAIQIFPEDTGLALHGDTVEVQVNPGLRRRRDGKGTERTGRVLRVVERANETIVGNLKKIRDTFYVSPDDPRLIHDIVVPDPAAAAKSKSVPSNSAFASGSRLSALDSRLDATGVAPAPGDKVVVRLAPWTKRNSLLEGEIIERLGKTFEPRAELLGVYRKFNLDPTFPAEVEREVATLPESVRPAELAGRLDCRELLTFTIDPDDAKDFDDALSLETLANGDLRVGVHIADVSAYVQPGTALDKEAYRRGNSTYLVGTVIPMLPEKLSNGLCSLVEAQDRLTKAVFLTFDRDGRPKDHAYANTVIRSRKRLTYHQAYALLFEKKLDAVRALPLPPKHQTGSTGRALNSLTDAELTELQSAVRLLWKIASRLRRERMKAGSLDLDMPETKVFVDADGYADRLEKIVHDESHQLIEEFMLAANEAVARLTRSQRLPSLYRVHDEPDPDKLAELREFLATFDIKTGDLTRRDEIVRLLRVLEDHPQGYTLRTQLLRSMKKACYRATPDGHFGLAKKDYTHFTSPIRRYADLVVHRVLGRYLARQAGGQVDASRAAGYTAARMEAIGEHLSLTEINSAEAERESVKIKLLEFFERELAKETKTRFAAVITDVRPHGLFVELVESMAFGFIPTKSLPDDYYETNADDTALIGRRTKKSYALGARIDVIVDKVDRFKRLIDFRLPTEKASTFPVLKKQS